MRTTPSITGLNLRCDLAIVNVMRGIGLQAEADAAFKELRYRARDLGARACSSGHDSDVPQMLAGTDLEDDWHFGYFDYENRILPAMEEAEREDCSD